MGLDIGVYKNVKQVTDESVLEKIQNGEESPHHMAYELGYVVPWFNEHFPGREEGLKQVPYEVADQWSFRAGSYSGYGDWRRELAMLVGIGDIESFWSRVVKLEKQGQEPDVPFWQLLHFSDCEGAIGPVVCKKLAKDFADWEERAKTYAKEMHEASRIAVDYPFEEAIEGHGLSSEGSYFWKKYQEWKQAFEDGIEGWVQFR